MTFSIDNANIHTSPFFKCSCQSVRAGPAVKSLLKEAWGSVETAQQLSFVTSPSQSGILIHPNMICSTGQSNKGPAEVPYVLRG